MRRRDDDGLHLLALEGVDVQTVVIDRHRYRREPRFLDDVLYLRMAGRFQGDPVDSPASEHVRGHTEPLRASCTHDDLIRRAHHASRARQIVGQRRTQLEDAPRIVVAKLPGFDRGQRLAKGTPPRFPRKCTEVGLTGSEIELESVWLRLRWLGHWSADGIGDRRGPPRRRDQIALRDELVIGRLIVVSKGGIIPRWS